MSERIFIIDDEPDLLKNAKATLREEGFSVDGSTSGVEGLKRVLTDPPDLLLLDIRIPDLDGFAICRQVKADPKTKHVPIVMLSAKAEEVDVVVGFELGAEDYIVKPFRRRELMARIRSIFRRNRHADRPLVVHHGALSVDLNSYTATAAGEKLNLTPKELELLAFFLRHESQVVTRATLSSEIWGLDMSSSSRTIDVHIDQLRKKLSDQGVTITGLKGVGYRFEVSD